MDWACGWSPGKLGQIFRPAAKMVEVSARHQRFSVFRRAGSVAWRMGDTRGCSPLTPTPPGCGWDLRSGIYTGSTVPPSSLPLLPTQTVGRRGTGAGSQRCTPHGIDICGNLRRFRRHEDVFGGTEAGGMGALRGPGGGADPHTVNLSDDLLPLHKSRRSPPSNSPVDAPLLRCGLRGSRTCGSSSRWVDGIQ